MEKEKQISEDERNIKKYVQNALKNGLCEIDVNKANENHNSVQKKENEVLEL